MATLIDGICASQNLDTAGEIIDIAGLDISSLDRDGTLNWEHKSDQPFQVVGKILKAKKIFSEEDCANEREAYFWNKCRVPFVYILGELADDYVDSAKHVAGLFKYDHDRRGKNQGNILGFSVEGAKLPGAKNGMVITKSIARRCTITQCPANKASIAEIVPTVEKKDDLDDIFKSEDKGKFSTAPKYEIELIKSEDKDRLLQKQEDPTKHAKVLGINPFKKVEPLSGSMPTSPSFGRSEMNKALRWTPKRAAGAVHFSHPEYGTISVNKIGANQFEVRHNGGHANIGGKKAIFSSVDEAGAHTKKYIASLASGQTPGKRAVDRPSPGIGSKKFAKNDMKKAITAGSGAVAPSQLEGGAALAKENLNKTLVEFKKKVIEKNSPPMPSRKTGVHQPTHTGPKGGTSRMGRQVRQGFYSTAKATARATTEGARNIKPKLVKSSWLQTATEEYDGWDKKEHFKKFMKSKMPHLAEGEIDAIGKTLALKRSVTLEKALSRINPAYQETAHKGSHIKKALVEFKGTKGSPVGLKQGDRVKIKGSKGTHTFSGHIDTASGKRNAVFHSNFGHETHIPHDHVHSETVSKIKK